MHRAVIFPRFGGITIVASSVFVPTKTRNCGSWRCRKPLFLLVGVAPQTLFQSRGWLRIRFPNAVVPDPQGQAGPTSCMEPETTTSVFPGKRRNWSAPLPAIGSRQDWQGSVWTIPISGADSLRLMVVVYLATTNSRNGFTSFRYG